MSGEHLDEPLDYLYEELPPERMAEVRRHLAECPECRAEMRDIRDAVKTYRLAPRPSTPPGLAARTAARALGEAAAERHAAPPAPAKPAGDTNFISEARFDQEFARLKEEVMGEMASGWRTWFYHPAWMVAACAFFICFILIHVSPRTNRHYEQLPPRPTAPHREIAAQSRKSAPAIETMAEAEAIAAEPSATLLQAEAMSEALEVPVSEPESAPATQARKREAAIPPEERDEDSAPALSEPAHKTAVPPLDGKLPESAYASGEVRQPVPLRPPAKVPDAAVIRDESSEAAAPPVSAPVSAPIAPVLQAVDSSAQESREQTPFGSVQADTLNPAISSVYQVRERGAETTDTPPASGAANGSDGMVSLPTESSLAVPELPVMPDSSQPAVAETPAAKSSPPTLMEQGTSADYGVFAGSANLESSDAGQFSMDVNTTIAPPPEPLPQSMQFDSYSGGSDVFAPLTPPARSSGRNVDVAEPFYSAGLPEPAQSVPPQQGFAGVPAPEFFDATDSYRDIPQIVERPTPVDRAQSARNLTTLAALALAEGNVAEAWEAVRILRSIDPKAADQVAKWITELEEARLAAETELPPELPAASTPQPVPMELVEPPENPPLTHIEVPPHIPASAVIADMAPPPLAVESSGTDVPADHRDDGEPAVPQSSAQPAGSLWHGTVGRDIRPVGRGRAQPAGQTWGRRPGTGKPFTTDPYLRDD